MFLLSSPKRYPIPNNIVSSPEQPRKRTNRNYINNYIFVSKRNEVNIWDVI
nr:MAG TPA: hypothetical protein [Caudoviricetes sp.]